VELALDDDWLAGASGNGEGGGGGEVRGVDGDWPAAAELVRDLGSGRKADARLAYAAQFGPLEADALLVQMKAWSQHDLGK